MIVPAASETPDPMTPEMIAILAVGAALAGLVWQSQRSLRVEMRDLRAELSERMDRIESRMDRIEIRMERMEGRLAELGDRVSRIEGMLHLHLGRNEEPAAPAE